MLAKIFTRIHSISGYWNIFWKDMIEKGGSTRKSFLIRDSANKDDNLLNKK